MKIRFLGCGDAFGSGGRFNTCFLVDWRGGRFLIDCGASSMIAMQRFGVDPTSLDAILVSHLHGDHYGGLPFLLLHARYIARRERRLRLAGPPTFRARLSSAMDVLFPGSSPLLEELNLDLSEIEAEHPHEILAGLRVTPFLVDHYSGAPAYALRVECEGRILCYSGDTEWTETLVPAARDADLFVCEASVYEGQVKMHLSLKTLESHLPRIRPKRLILTHMSADMLGRLGDLPYETAEDGMEVEV